MQVRTQQFVVSSSDRAPAHVPGALFFCGSTLMFIALLLAVRSFRKNPVTHPAESA